jgi:hypothetical protein
VAVYVTTEARYLPTRSQDDRLDRLRELLRDVSYFSYVLALSPGLGVQKFQLNDQCSERTSVFVKFSGSGSKLTADFKDKYRSRCSLKAEFSQMSSVIYEILNLPDTYKIPS